MSYSHLDYFTARRVVQGLIGDRAVVRWNDNPIRTYDEVLRVAKEADELLEGLI